MDFFQKDKESLLRGVDNLSLRSGTGGVIQNGQGDRDNGLILLQGDVSVPEYIDKTFIASLSLNSHAVIITSDLAYQPDVPTGADLMLNTRRLEAVFKSRGFDVTSLRSPAPTTIKRLIKDLKSKNLNKESQLIIVLNQQVSDDGNILLGNTRDKVEIFPIEDVQELISLQEQAGHSLMITNSLKVGRVKTPSSVEDLKDKTSEELLQLILESGNTSATRSANNLTQQATKTEAIINKLIEEMIKRSGGYGTGTAPLYPNDKAAVAFEFIKGSAGYSLESQVTQFADLLASYYRNLKVADADERGAAVKGRFTARSLNGKKWDVGTFTDKTLGESIPILEEITADVRAAEKAYLLALAKTL